MTDFIYDLPSVLRAIRCNDVPACINTHEDGYMVHIGEGHLRSQIVLPATRMRHAAGWLKRASMHLPKSIDWNAGTWEVRR